MADTFEQLYPHIARWVMLRGYVNIVHDDDSFHPAFVQALDAGGMIWEGDPSYRTLDDALRALDDAIRDWLLEQGSEK